MSRSSRRMSSEYRKHQLQYFTCNSLSSNNSQYTDSRLSSQLPSSELASYDYSDISDISDLSLYNSGLSNDSSLSYDSSYSSEQVNSFASEATSPLAPTPPCIYPSGSIACKTWNQTNVDCAQRSLTCIPHFPRAASVELLDLERNNIIVLPDFSFIRFQNLIRLYLGSNEISFIGNHTFSGLGNLLLLDLGSNKIFFIGSHTFSELNKLEHLNLQSNRLRTVSGSPFRGLTSLKTLHFHYGYYRHSKPLFTASFAGLTCLEELQIDIANWGLIENVSFQQLLMLDSLTFTIQYGVNTFPPDVFGLSQLKSLRIYGNAPTRIDLCNLSALENIYLGTGFINVSNKCNTTSLKYFTLDQSYYMYLYKYGIDDLVGLIFLQALQMLNSPLEKLLFVYPVYYKDTKLVFNSTYFEPLATFRSSLHELSLNAEAYDIELEGSPFNHFHKLKKLTIKCNSLSSSNALNLFKGLKHLQELQLKCHETLISDIFLTFVLSQPIILFKSLKRITLSSDMFEVIPNTLYITDVWCNLPSLEYMELSQVILNPSIDCLLPHLHTIIGRWISDGNECKVAPHLQKMDLSSTRFESIPFVQQCLYLRFLNLSHARWFNSPDVTSDMPLLEELYLSDIYDGINLAFDVLRGFKAPTLRYLDISYNSISVITKDDAKLLSTVTFLDLTGNALVSFDYVQYLVNIETLILKSNYFTTFPAVLFDDSSTFQLLNVIDLSGNPIVCDCSIQAFRSWIISDLRVRLLREPKSDIQRCSYCCASPDASEGLSVTEIDLDCKSLLLTYIVIGLISAVFLVIVGLLVALYHWNIKNRLFLLLNRRRDPVVYLDDDDDDDEDENGIPRYDAYISYCNEDEDWICDELDPTIEGGAEPLRLCIRGRDIPANRPILQSISLYMKRSRKVVLILSPRYIDNRGRNQCKFELALAHQRLQEENEKVLILIILEEIPDRQMTLMLRQLFNRVLCLKWPGDECGQGLFWQRLREELKRRVPVDEYYEAHHPQAMELQMMA